jgi:hypothetical protein
MKRKILSFDVGIRNLAWCLIQTSSKTSIIETTTTGNLRISSSQSQSSLLSIPKTTGWDILDWGIWDLRMDKDDITIHPETCYYKSRKGSPCIKSPVYYEISNGITLGGVCQTHSKIAKVKDVEDSIRKIKTMTVKELKEYAPSLIPEYSIQGKLKKEIHNDCFKFLTDNCLRKIPKLKKAKQISLTDIHMRILQRLEDFPMDLDLVIIENQPVKLNALMKSIQMILWTSLRMCMIQKGNSHPRVQFINADKKLFIVPDSTSSCLFRIQKPDGLPKSSKTETSPESLENDITEIIIPESETDPDEPIFPEVSSSIPNKKYNPFQNIKFSKKSIKREKYKQRKMTAVDITMELLKDTNETYYQWFQKQSKKDDLADSLLMCLYSGVENGWIQSIENDLS